MSEVAAIGLDIAKSVFQAHGADADGRQLFSRRIARGKLLEFFAAQPRCLVAMEACGGAHHWARSLMNMGHEVRWIPPAYVNPFVKRQKNDAADAEAICEAAQRPNIRFVAVKTEEQQASGLGIEISHETVRYWWTGGVRYSPRDQACASRNIKGATVSQRGAESGATD